MGRERRTTKTLRRLREKLSFSHWAPMHHPQLDEFLEEQFFVTRGAVQWAMTLGAFVYVIRGLMDVSNGVGAPMMHEMGWRVATGLMMAFVIYMFATSKTSGRGQIWMGAYMVVLVGGIVGTLHLAALGRESTTLIPIVLVYLLSTALWTKTSHLRWSLIVSSAMVGELFVTQVISVEHMRTFTFYILDGIGLGLVIRHGRLQTAFDNFLLRRHLSAQALNDPLTGVLNRSGWENRLVGTLKGGQAPRPSCLLFFDLDHFKKINDEHGHAVGDDVLKQAAKMIHAGLREGDVLARFGGEEFVVFLPGTNRRDAKAVAERIRIIIEQTVDPVPLTVSIGVAEFLPGETVDMAMERADHALLDAKQTGRNKVVFAADVRVGEA